MSSQSEQRFLLQADSRKLVMGNFTSGKGLRAAGGDMEPITWGGQSPWGLEQLVLPLPFLGCLGENSLPSYLREA